MIHRAKRYLSRYGTIFSQGPVTAKLESEEVFYQQYFHISDCLQTTVNHDHTAPGYALDHGEVDLVSPDLPPVDTEHGGPHSSIVREDQTTDPVVSPPIR
jgi:hypothetical protein